MTTEATPTLALSVVKRVGMDELVTLSDVLLLAAERGVSALVAVLLYQHSVNPNVVDSQGRSGT